MEHLDLCRRIKAAGGTPYVVGGAVRDLVMGHKVNDVDLCVVGMTMEKLQEVLPEGEQPVGKAFPILIVKGIEIALARKDRKVGPGYTGFECDTANVSLKDDLWRRDLTINAMAMDPFTGDIQDPFGGQKDIEAKLLRPVSDHFTEDPLRVLRAARFAAQLGFEPTTELLRMGEFLAHDMNTLPGERILMELMKALRTEHPSMFLLWLDALRCLEVVLPEITALKGRVQPEQHHPEGDAFVHTLLVVDRARQLGADDATMFAALVHDLGKAITDDDNLPHHYNHEALGVHLVQNLCDRLNAPLLFKQTGVATAREHLNVHRFDKLKPVTRVRLLDRLGAAHGDTLIERVTLASQADAQGRGPLFIDKPYPQREAMLAAASKFRTVRGDQFASLRDGEKIRQKLEQARAKVLQ
jgi:tRNA nucleotidyltransferase (CCA-adding enzyme)